MSKTVCSNDRPWLAVTPGEPAGIGPDLVIQRAQQPQSVNLVICANGRLLEERAAQLGLPLQVLPFEPGVSGPCEPGQLYVIDHALAAPVNTGQLDPNNARYVLNCLDTAIAGCQDGTFQAVVTGPVHKGVINDAGIAFSGHTEYLADKTHTEQVVMMLATEGLRVALVTTHLPLKAVADAITQTTLRRVIEIVHNDLQGKFGITKPKLLVCGLNPHAGEGGHLGTEELTVINPVIEQLKAADLHLTGPLPADTAFTPGPLANADAVIAMYHDQGLPVLKHKGFHQAVNITLGLPIIRTSVDHGTALDLAGTGQADLGSLAYAIDQAQIMARAHA